ncbi:hypothetical protein, partial [Escherichia coli]|uniref:hypothetical protein n=1 Tax=Escherichia coli TaxID=562 RepID=UPI001BC8433D
MGEENKREGRVRRMDRHEEEKGKSIWESGGKGGRGARGSNVKRGEDGLRRSNRDNQPVHRGYRLP